MTPFVVGLDPRSVESRGVGGRVLTRHGDCTFRLVIGKPERGGLVFFHQSGIR